MQIFTTIFDVLWLLAVLGLLIFIAVASNRRLDKLENALVDSTTRSHTLAQTSAEATRLLVERNIELAKEPREAVDLEPIDGHGVSNAGSR